MNEERIKNLVDEKKLRPRQMDKPRVLSILSAAEQTAVAVKTVPVNEQTATMVFREMYEAIRQIGDAKWWLKGYEPWGHEVSAELLMDENNVAFQHLDSFRRIRNDANYRGYKVTIEQANEILLFWKTYGNDLLLSVKKTLETL